MGEVQACEWQARPCLWLPLWTSLSPPGELCLDAFTSSLQVQSYWRSAQVDTVYHLACLPEVQAVLGGVGSLPNQDHPRGVYSLRTSAD